MELEKMDVQLKAGRIKRYHTMSIIGEQSVGEHSYGVAQLVRILADDDCSVELLMAALDHDVAEIHIGDTPHPAKVRSSSLKHSLDSLETEFNEQYEMNHQLTTEEWTVLKTADLLEMGFFGIHQIRLGNSYAHTVVDNVLVALQKISPTVSGTMLTIHLEQQYAQSQR